MEPYHAEHQSHGLHHGVIIASYLVGSARQSCYVAVASAVYNGLGFNYYRPRLALKDYPFNSGHAIDTRSEGMEKNLHPHPVQQVQGHELENLRVKGNHKSGFL